MNGQLVKSIEEKAGGGGGGEREREFECGRGC